MRAEHLHQIVILNELEPVLDIVPLLNEHLNLSLICQRLLLNTYEESVDYGVCLLELLLHQIHLTVVPDNLQSRKDSVVGLHDVLHNE